MTPKSLAVAVVVVVIMTASAALATSIIERTPEELAQASALVVEGKVAGVRSYWNQDHSRIYTETTVDVDGTYKGAAGSRVRVLQPGGVVGNVRMTAHGALGWTKGEEVLLFLEASNGSAYEVAGFSQGKYTIERDRTSGQKYVRQASPENTRGAQSAPGADATRATNDRVPMQQFLDRVLSH